MYKKIKKLVKEFDEKFGMYSVGFNYEEDVYSEVKQFIQSSLEEQRKEIARQLERTILFYEKELEEPQPNESLETKIRAFIRHELMNSKSLKEQ